MSRTDWQRDWELNVKPKLQKDIDRIIEEETQKPDKVFTKKAPPYKMDIKISDEGFWNKVNTFLKGLFS